MRTSRVLLMFLALWTITAAPAQAGDRSKLVGSWKAVSYDIEVEGAKQRSPALGAKPNGCLIFTPGGRMTAYLEASGRRPAATDTDRAALYRTMLAYSGRYRLESGAWVTRVDASWNPLWLGTDQKRFYRIEGDRLYVTTEWTLAPGGRRTRGQLVFEREQ